MVGVQRAPVAGPATRTPSPARRSLSRLLPGLAAVALLVASAWGQAVPGTATADLFSGSPGDRGFGPFDAGKPVILTGTIAKIEWVESAFSGVDSGGKAHTGTYPFYIVTLLVPGTPDADGEANATEWTIDLGPDYLFGLTMTEEGIVIDPSTISLEAFQQWVFGPRRPDGSMTVAGPGFAIHWTPIVPPVPVSLVVWPSINTAQAGMLASVIYECPPDAAIAPGEHCDAAEGRVIHGYTVDATPTLLEASALPDVGAGLLPRGVTWAIAPGPGGVCTAQAEGATYRYTLSMTPQQRRFTMDVDRPYGQTFSIELVMSVDVTPDVMRWVYQGNYRSNAPATLGPYSGSNVIMFRNGVVAPPLPPGPGSIPAYELEVAAITAHGVLSASALQVFVTDAIGRLFLNPGPECGGDWAAIATAQLIADGTLIPGLAFTGPAADLPAPRPVEPLPPVVPPDDVTILLGARDWGLGSRLAVSSPITAPFGSDSVACVVDPASGHFQFRVSDAGIVLIVSGSARRAGPVVDFVVDLVLAEEGDWLQFNGAPFRITQPLSGAVTVPEEADATTTVAYVLAYARARANGYLADRESGPLQRSVFTTLVEISQLPDLADLALEGTRIVIVDHAVTSEAEVYDLALQALAYVLPQWLAGC